jgi:hypothetical protein
LWWCPFWFLQLLSSSMVSCSMFFWLLFTEYLLRMILHCKAERRIIASMSWSEESSSIGWLKCTCSCSAYLLWVLDSQQQIWEPKLCCVATMQERLQDLVLGKCTSGLTSLFLFPPFSWFHLQSMRQCLLFDDKMSFPDLSSDYVFCRIFLVIQLLSIVNFVYYWNEDWLSEKKERNW